MIGWTSALHADSVYFLDVLGHCHECRHWTERLAHEIGVKTCDDDSYASVGKGLHYIDESFVKELGLIDADYFYVA